MSTEPFFTDQERYFLEAEAEWYNDTWEVVGPVLEGEAGDPFPVLRTIANAENGMPPCFVPGASATDQLLSYASRCRDIYREQYEDTSLDTADRTIAQEFMTICSSIIRKLAVRPV